MKNNLLGIRTSIVEDDQIFGYALQKILTKICPSLDIVSVATTAEQAKADINQNSPDLLLMDVQLPNNKKSYDLLEGIKNPLTQIIFMSSFPEEKNPRLLSKYGIVDFLSKPIDLKLLKTALKKAEKRIIDHQLLSNFKEPSTSSADLNPSHATSQNTIVLSLTKGRITKVKLDEVLRCESYGDLTKLYFNDSSKERLTVVKSLKKCEQSFRPDLFCRVHKQHLVNLSFVNKIHLRKKPEVEMVNGDMIPIGRRRKQEVFDRFHQLEH